MKVYKGTDKDMKCRGMQYELGKTEKTDDAIRCGDKGFHSCEAPFDVLRYYPLCDGNRYFEAEADGKIDRTNANDSKVASSELTLKAEIGFAKLVKAQIEFTRKKAESGTAGGVGCLIIARNGAKAKGGLNSVIVFTHWEYAENTYKPVMVQTVIVDGENIKADTWYMLKDGEIVEVENVAD